MSLPDARLQLLLLTFSMRFPHHRPTHCRNYYIINQNHPSVSLLLPPQVSPLLFPLLLLPPQLLPLLLLLLLLLASGHCCCYRCDCHSYFCCCYLQPQNERRGKFTTITQSSQVARMVDKKFDTAPLMFICCHHHVIIT